MDTLLLEKRRPPRRFSREHPKIREEPEDIILSLSNALLFRSAFGKMHLSPSLEHNTDYGAVRSKKHLKCRQ